MLALRRSTVLLTCLLLVACSSTRPTAPGTARPSLASSEQSRDAAIHAMGLVGTPYRYGGNTVDGGFDCSGLIGFVYRQSAGLATPRTVAQLADYGTPIARDDLRTGDLVLFGGSRPTHAGIYVGENRFVHAPSTGGEVRLDRLDGPYWSRQRVEVRRP
ncbi:C40 family peptidase [Variovorax sp. PBL-H6]|uniref:C40 family peptidase n=1 Tax=Variovorax sp. PBL-H6 TaxID=434009 RepID=UPI0013A53EDD|nr:C40 family peptidase [Variovorax sp. PBL-H6]